MTGKPDCQLVIEEAGGTLLVQYSSQSGGPWEAGAGGYPGTDQQLPAAGAFPGQRTRGAPGNFRVFWVMRLGGALGNFLAGAFLGERAAIFIRRFPESRV